MHYRTATKLSLEDGDVQVSAFIYSMGKDAESIFKSFDNEDEWFRSLMSTSFRKEYTNVHAFISSVS